jgi:hypothetical protein
LLEASFGVLSRLDQCRVIRGAAQANQGIDILIPKMKLGVDVRCHDFPLGLALLCHVLWTAKYYLRAVVFRMACGRNLEQGRLDVSSVLGLRRGFRNRLGRDEIRKLRTGGELRVKWEMDNFSCNHCCTSGATLVRGASVLVAPTRPAKIT